MLDAVPGLAVESLSLDTSTQRWHLHYTVAGLSRHYAEATTVPGLDVPLPDA